MDVWLVLDDFHAVDNRDIVQGIAALLDRLPSHVHVVISTRVDPDLPLPRWRVRGELVEIRAADLRFTADEAAAYLNDVAGLGLAEEDVAVLEQRTEGWVAALQLAALSIRGHEDVRGFISRFAGNDRYIVDYLVEEVLQRQPAEVREFLSQSSVLDRLSGPLCDAVTGGQGGREMLEALERANLFVVSLDDRREWYRYHHLFADALRARMLNDDPAHVAVGHLRASEWYERHNLTDDAVRHAIAAADFDRATRLIEQAIPIDPTRPRRHAVDQLAPCPPDGGCPRQPAAQRLLWLHAHGIGRHRRCRAMVRARRTSAGGRAERVAGAVARYTRTPLAPGNHSGLPRCACTGSR